MLYGYIYLKQHSHEILCQRIVHLASNTGTLLQHQCEAASFGSHSQLNKSEDRKCSQANTKQIDPRAPVPGPQNTKANGGFVFTPQPVAIGAEHPENVRSRRQNRVVRRASSSRIHPSTIEAIEHIAAVDSAGIIQAQPGIL